MRRCLAGLSLMVAAVMGMAPVAYACGGLVAPNGAVKLLQTTTLVAYHQGVEHYVTSFEYAGGGARFGSIIPLPGVPTSVTRGGSWTLQRLEREVHPVPAVDNEADAFRAASAGSAQVLLKTTVDALNITVLRGGGPAVTDWVRQHGFAVSRDLPAMLDFYARRSPIFLTAEFDATREAARGLSLGDGTPVQITIPTSNPWVPLHILSLAKDKDDLVAADVFLLTDHRPSILSGPGVRLVQSRPAESSLLGDLRSNKGMSWIAPSGWLSYLALSAPAGSLDYDLAVNAAGDRVPSRSAAVVPVTLRDALLTGVTPDPDGRLGTGWCWALSLGVAVAALVGATVATRRARTRQRLLR
jgi:hypothetical protein